MTVTTNYVLLLGTISSLGITRGFHPHHGQLATFALVLRGQHLPWGYGPGTAIPCELHGALAQTCDALQPGALVLVTGGLAVRDDELGEDTARLVVVGTALTVVQQGEEKRHDATL